MRIRCPECEAGLVVTAADDGRKIECPKCGEVFRARLDDEDDDRPRKKTRKRDREEEPAGNNSKVLAIGGGVAAAVVAVGAVVWVVAGRSKPENPKPADNPPQVAAAKPNSVRPVVPNPQTPPQTPPALGPANGQAGQPQGGTGPAPVSTQTQTQPQTPTVPPEVAELGDLLTRTVSSPIPTQRLGTLKRADGEGLSLEVPTFYSLAQARRKKDVVVPKAAKLTPDEVKAATAYIKVERPDGSGGTGSGFYVGSIPGPPGQPPRGLVATNHHVIEAALARPAPGKDRPTITVVFNSNVRGKEVSLPARVTAIDPIADLAILTVPGDKLPAKPIDPYSAVKPVEGMDVQICGFPLGADLAAGEAKNPNITVNPGSVSGLPMDENGKLDRVQITGLIIPGNSGGPVVDKADRRLVGVTVSTIPSVGMQIGYAVPVNELIALAEGKLLATLLLPTGLDTGFARFKVVVPVMDPWGKVDKVYLRYWTGSGDKPKAEKDPRMGHKPIKGGKDITMPVSAGPSSLQLAIGDLEIPADADEVVLQLAAESSDRADGLDRRVAASPPVTFKLTPELVPVPSDARPFADLAGPLAGNPASLAGQTVVVRGKIVKPPTSRGPVQEVELCDLAGKRPAGVRFVCDRETATQFDEVEDEHQGHDVRLTCLVGGKGSDGRTVVRVARVDFLDDNDRPVKSIPGEAKDDKLAALNRDPDKFAGQTLDLVARAAPVLDRKGGGSAEDFVVVFANQRRPRNLQFVTTPGLAKRLADEKFRPNGLYKVRLGVKVDAPTTPGGLAKVTVRRVDILDPKDETKPPLKTIE
ncbi:MAG: trypsin-like peptidase domain-containing protein [Gemmataceae bacterium]|nr:trypsin-like peptidase domain-containing protein [Gemmataceae bacterium]